MAYASSPGFSASRPKTSRAPFVRVLLITLLGLVLSLGLSEKAFAGTSAEAAAPSAAQMIEAVNALRIDEGLYALSAHPVLMQVAQIEADGIANGMPGHWRPDGMSLGQWLISLGYPLAGDLTQDGYRSENWGMANSVEEAVQGWLGDGEHTNTMLSPNRSDIGAGIAGGDPPIIVVITALQTGSGQMQAAAAPMLTQVASGNDSLAEGALVSQFINPVTLSTARPSGDVLHKIEYGQSLWSIAVAYHITVDQISAWNNLGEETIIYEGQVLLVQRNATQPPPATETPEPPSTPRSTATARRPAFTETPAAPGVTTSSDENSYVLSLSSGLRIGLILAVLGLAGGIMVWLASKAH